MRKYLTSQEILKWARVIFTRGDDPVQVLKHKRIWYKKTLIEDIALSLYQNLCGLKDSFISPLPLEERFDSISHMEMAVWTGFASDIPEKLSSLKLFIRPFTNFCHTCIITDKEIEKLARKDHERLCRELSLKGWKKGKIPDWKNKINPALSPFDSLSGKLKRFFMELNYLLPQELKNAGFEIMRAEELAEINEKMVSKIARAIHSRYYQEIHSRGTKSVQDLKVAGFYAYENKNCPDVSDFDDLPEEIKFSNTDNAYHIPAKLLSIGYKIRQAGKGFKPAALHLNAKEVETMSKVEHIRWCWDKRLNGWTYGPRRDNMKKKHPGLVPYESLKESEKEKDRELVRLIPSFLKDIGYVAYPVNPNRIKNLSYALKPQSSIHKILEETNLMNSQIRVLVKSTPAIDGMIEKRNRKIEEAIKEVEDSYNYARHIQETFLPDNLYIRECFPESFTLYKPRDIVSGDFYFFSKKENLIIFAVADCTGHGIPGALLSTLGYGLLDQAVNEIKLTDPSSILQHLYSKMHRFLRNEEGSGVPDDMDIVLCSFNSTTNLLSWANVRNSFYRISLGRLIEYNYNSTPGDYREPGDSIFKTTTITLKRGDIIYLSSDGYTDQFGGVGHKRYQTARFRTFLLSIHNKPMAEQGDLLFEEIEKWREENDEDQTDDILVIGITI